MIKTVKRLDELKKISEEHNDNYYVLDNPVISDKEWDTLFRELQELEKNNPSLIDKNSPTQRVGAQPLKDFKTVAHRKPMLSLSKSS